jgi:hypothetical protein
LREAKDAQLHHGRRGRGGGYCGLSSKNWARCYNFRNILAKKIGENMAFFTLTTTELCKKIWTRCYDFRIFAKNWRKYGVFLLKTILSDAKIGS